MVWCDLLLSMLRRGGGGIDSWLSSLKCFHLIPQLKSDSSIPQLAQARVKQSIFHFVSESPLSRCLSTRYSKGLCWCAGCGHGLPPPAAPCEARAVGGGQAPPGGKQTPRHG